MVFPFTPTNPELEFPVEQLRPITTSEELFGIEPTVKSPRKQPNFLGEQIEERGIEFEGGRASTKQGQDFIIDYMEQFGTAPSPFQLGQFKQGLGTDLDFLPGSTSGRMGFQNEAQRIAAQQANQQFGPGLGADVPQGGLIITRNGIPQFRTFEPERFMGEIERGEFVEPPGGLPASISELFGLGQAPVGIPEEVAGVVQRGPTGEFVPPTADEALANFSPVQVYQARFDDFLTQQITESQPGLKQLEQQFDDEIDALQKRINANPLLTQADFNLQEADIDRQFAEAIENSGLMTEDKKNAILAEVQTGIGRGLSPEEIHRQLSTQFLITQAPVGIEGVLSGAQDAQPKSILPSIGDIQGIVGAKVGELQNQGIEISKQRFGQAQPPAFTGPLEEEVQIFTGTEQRDYFSLVEGQGLNPQVEQFQKGRFQELLAQWRRAGSGVPFIVWIQEQLSRQ